MKNIILIFLFFCGIIFIILSFIRILIGLGKIKCDKYNSLEKRKYIKKQGIEMLVIMSLLNFYILCLIIF